MPASRYATEQQIALIHYRLHTVKKIDDPDRWLADFLKKPENCILTEHSMLTSAGARVILDTMLTPPKPDWEK